MAGSVIPKEDLLWGPNDPNGAAQGMKTVLSRRENDNSVNLLDAGTTEPAGAICDMLDEKPT